MQIPHLTVRRLHDRYAEIRKTGYLAGSSQLYELQRLAHQCASHLTGFQQHLCAQLEAVFGSVAASQDGEPVSPEEGARLLDLLDQPISQCLDFIEGLPMATTAEALGQALTAAYFESRKKP
jgi:hypothetical protein